MRDRFQDLIQRISKEELINYYKNHSREDTLQHFSIKIDMFYKICNYYNYEKSIEDKMECRRNTLIEKYGSVKNFYSYQNEKAKATKKERYGDPNYNNNDKITQTFLTKYGVKRGAQLEDYLDKRKTTNLRKYGDENYNNIEQIKRTNLQRYGYESVSSVPEIKQQQWDTLYKNAGSKEAFYNQAKEKRKATKLLRYGDPYYNNPEKQIQTMNERYGVNYYSQTEDFRNSQKEKIEEIKIKQYNTKKKNNSFKTSKDEEYLYRLLIEKFGEKDVIRNYKDPRYIKEETGYQYVCDFYIKSLDLFIELNYFITHGPHPYNKNNEKDNLLLRHYKETCGVLFENIQYVWTDLDVRKREIAKKNNLKYLEIYPGEDLKDVVGRI